MNTAKPIISRLNSVNRLYWNLRLKRVTSKQEWWRGSYIAPKGCEYFVTKVVVALKKCEPEALIGRRGSWYHVAILVISDTIPAG